MKENEKLEFVVWSAISAVGILLSSGNIYFIKHTLDRLDSIEAMVYQIRQDVAILNAKQASFSGPCQSPRLLLLDPLDPEESFLPSSLTLQQLPPIF